ncbi:MAG TPA: methyltransferase [Burkholderiales bacterium]|nr:methyltransferase [Burkholderiales bacterium]
MGRAVLAALAAGAGLAAISNAAWAQGADSLIDQALVGNHRAEANKARDKYRHPRETLLFFGLRPDMAVVEISPSRGWYTEILAPVLRDRGQYYAAVAAITEKTPDALKKNDADYRDMLAAAPDLYGKVRLSVLSPGSLQVAPPGSVDLVLTFRNVHNWAKAGTAEAMFRAFYDALKSGGTLGVVEHRAKADASFQQQIDTGYMTEGYVVETARKAGFRLVNKSDINANPRDTKDYPGGVWTLPPTLRYGDKDRDKYLAIGESDRMTLKFEKP